MIPTSTPTLSIRSSNKPGAADAVAVFIHKQTQATDAIGAGLSDAQRRFVGDLIKNKLVRGKSNEATVQWLNGGSKGQRLIVIGLGNREKFSIECLREAGATLAKTARRHRIGSIVAVLPELPERMPGVPDAEAAESGVDAGIEAFATGFVVANFDYEEYKGAVKAKKKNDDDEVRTFNLTIVADGGAAVKQALERGRIVGEAQNFARTIASRPGNDINPLTLAKVAQQLAKETGLGYRVLDEKQMQRLGMGGILAVGAGSRMTPPRLIVLEHKGRGAARAGAGKNAKPLLVVGKAITFDTGGISIKPADKMGKMIYDKCGGMTVLGLMAAVARLKLPVHVVGILTSAENHISETAYRPGDILRMYNGVTVEVTNTDAEGRLVLADALAWGIEQYKPAAVIDLATLTGGVIVALGKTMAGIISNDDGLTEALVAAGHRAGEKMWRLPLGEDQKNQIKSDHADIVNSAGRDGHPLQGGAFLSHFIPEKGTPWAHLDIAGVADTERELTLYTKGATGWGVRTLLEWVRSRT